MYGPPGCGKTYLARATAGEVKAGFLSVGISDVLDMWIGSSEKNLHELFEQARRNKPCVLFFDEVDALGASRADMRHSGGRHLINQFLAELDGVRCGQRGPADPRGHQRAVAPRQRVPPAGPLRPHPVRAAARRRRPGPRSCGCMLAGKPADGVDFDQVAKKTDDFSGADLKAVVDLAVEAKLREAMKIGQAPTAADEGFARRGRRQSSPRHASGSPRPATTRSTPTRAGRTTRFSSI